MSNVAEFMNLLATHTRPDRAADWDPVGLQLGDPASSIEVVGVCHEVTEEVVAAIESDPVDLVVSYHPLLFRPTTRLVAGVNPNGRAFRLVAAGVALAVTHTDFDAAPGGTADSLASALGLDDVSGFGPIKPSEQVKIVTFVPTADSDRVASAMSQAGAGRIGNYTGCSFRSPGTGTFHPQIGANPASGMTGELNREPEVRLEMLARSSATDGVVAALMAAHPYEEAAFDVYPVTSNHGLLGRIGTFGGNLGDLAALAGERLGSSGLRVGGDPERPCRRVAVVPGAGSSFIAAAAGAGADAMVTGDVDHHQAVAALDRGVAVVDPGHAATEMPGMASLNSIVAGLGLPTRNLVGLAAGPWLDL